MDQAHMRRHAPGGRWRRPRDRTAVTVMAVALAVLTVGQGLDSDPPAPDRGGEEGVLASTSQAVAAGDDGALEPISPHPLPDSRPVEVVSPQDRTQAEQEPAPRPTPNKTLETLDLSPVEAQRPAIRLAPAADAATAAAPGAAPAFANEEPPGDPVTEALTVDGVTFATAVEVTQLPINGQGGSEPVQVAAVDPNGFRVLTPQVTADAGDVWRRIAEGDAAFTHDVGTRLSLALGSRVAAGDGEGETLRVGAYASNGVPPVADVIVSKETARNMGLEGVQTLLVSVADDADVEAVMRELAAATGMEPEVIAPPPTRRAFLTGAAAREAFEPFSYVSIGDGMIQIDRDWVGRNIVSAQVPIFRGNVTCHRLLIPQLRAALQEIVDSGLDHLIDPSQYGGCWVPRHILFNPSRALSMHAWGLAIDFNVRGNEYGNRNPQMHPGIVEIFERWGFVWGGRWSTPDGMHFELGALLQDGERG